MKVTRYIDGKRLHWWEGYPDDGLDHHIASTYDSRPWWRRLLRRVIR
jgi:hypothetical protein